MLMVRAILLQMLIVDGCDSDGFQVRKEGWGPTILDMIDVSLICQFMVVLTGYLIECLCSSRLIMHLYAHADGI